MTDVGALRAEGYRLQVQGRHAEAAARYEQVVAAAPGDWEIWNNLGNARRASGAMVEMDPGLLRPQRGARTRRRRPGSRRRP